MPFLKSHRHLGRLFLFLFTLSSLNGCRLHQAGRSQLRHDFGMWSDLDDAPSVWYPASRSDFLSLRDDLEPYPDDHPRVTRLQAWVDVINQEIMKLSNKVAIPRPLVLLVKQDDPNAFVSSREICLPVQFSFIAGKNRDKDASPDGSDHGGLDLVIRKNKNKLSLALNNTPSECIQGPADVKLTEDVLRRLLGRNFSCVSKLSAQGVGANAKITGILERKCLNKDVSVWMDDEQISKRLVYRAMFPYIVVADSFFKLNEEEVVSILAHELGHYYRGHGVSSKRSYDFFYELNTDHNLASRPKALPASDVLAQLGQDAVDGAEDIAVLFPVSGQKLHSAFFLDALNDRNTMSKLCPSDDCRHICQDLNEQFSDEGKVRKIVGEFPHAPLPTSQKAKEFYQQFEERQLTCAAKIPWESVGKSDLNYFFSGWPVSDVLKKIQPNVPRTLADYLMTVSEKIGELIKQQNDASYGIYKQADDKHIGYYTEEQEADELALEILARLGLDVNAGVRAFLWALRESEATVGTDGSVPGVLNAAECQKALSDGFKTFVPIGDYGDNHHSICFRVYNLYREIEAHSADLAKAKPKVLPLSLDPNLWSKLHKNQ